MTGRRRCVLMATLATIALVASARQVRGCDHEERKSSPPRHGVSPKPHQDHNPKHGGIFYMASNGDYHMECVYVRPGVLKIYLYDKYTQPIQGAFFKAEASVSGAARDKHIPLKLADDGTLTAPLAVPSFPAEITVRISCPTVPWAKALDDNVTFPFERYSGEPQAVASTVRR